MLLNFEVDHIARLLLEPLFSTSRQTIEAAAAELLNAVTNDNADRTWKHIWIFHFAPILLVPHISRIASFPMWFETVGWQILIDVLTGISNPIGYLEARLFTPSEVTDAWRLLLTVAADILARVASQRSLPYRQLSEFDQRPVRPANIVAHALAMGLWSHNDLPVGVRASGLGVVRGLAAIAPELLRHVVDRFTRNPLYSFGSEDVVIRAECARFLCGVTALLARPETDADTFAAWGRMLFAEFEVELGRRMPAAAAVLPFTETLGAILNGAVGPGVRLEAATRAADMRTLLNIAIVEPEDQEQANSLLDFARIVVANCGSVRTELLTDVIAKINVSGNRWIAVLKEFLRMTGSFSALVDVIRGAPFGREFKDFVDKVYGGVD
jgi:hypothetical protein